MTACASAKANATALSSLGMIRRRASTIAIASMTSASRAPTAPRRPGSANRLAAALAIATQAIGAWAWIRGCTTIGSRACLIVMSSQLRSQRTAWRLGAGGSPQLRTQFLGHEVRIDTVANDLRPDEDDELGADGP